MNETTDITDGDSVVGGAETLVEALQQASEKGFAGQLIARDDGTVECPSCDTSSPAADIQPVRHQRLEGASDAADMMLLVEAHCPACDTGGVLTLGYGPNATAEDEAVLADLNLDNAPVNVDGSGAASAEDG